MTRLSDPALPGLALALDPDALAEMLSRRLPECARGVTIASARAVDVQYEPGQRATVLVRLKFHEPDTRRTTRQLLCLRVLKQGEATPTCPPEILARHAARRQTKEGARSMPLETAWLPLLDEGLLVQAFPLDPGLPSLLDITDPEALVAALTRLWSPRRVRAKRVRIDTLAYTPESRAALAYDVLCEDRRTLVPHQRRLVGKLHVRRSAARLFAGAWAVWRRAHGRVNIAPPVGYIESLGLSLQEFVQGTRLSDLAGTGAFIGPIRQAARGIAHVHSLHLPLHSERDLGKESAVVRRWLAVLDGILPERREEIARLGERLLAEMGRRFTPRGAVHADFHLANILVHRDEVTIVDWDQVAHGDPMLDVGRLLASLRVSALRTTQDAAGLSDAADAFLSTYLRASGEDESRARLFEASALLIAAAAPFRLQREGWKEQAEILLDEVWRCFDLAAPRASVSVPSVPAALPFHDRVEWARDPTFSMAIVGPLVRQARGWPGLDIVACTPRVTASSESGFEVEYALGGFLDGAPYEGCALAHGSAEHGGRGMLRRLEALRAALVDVVGAPRLPIPLGHATMLEVGVIEPLEREKDPFASVEGAAAVGRALAVLQTSRPPIDKERPLEKEILSARRRIDRLEDSVAAARASAVLARVEAGAPGSQPLVPTPRDPRPHEFTWDGASVGLVSVRDIALAPLPLAAGLLHARLVAHHAKDGVPSAFLDTWLDAVSLDQSAIRPFVALGLLRAACRSLRDGAGGEDGARELGLSLLDAGDRTLAD